MNSKYSNFLTILLVLIIIAIVAIIGFLGFKYYESISLKDKSENFVGTFVGEIDNGQNTNNNNNQEIKNDDDIYAGVDEGINNGGSGTSTNSEKPKFNNFFTDGTIEIPAINLSCPILSQSEYAKKGSLDTAPIILYGVGLNQIGITTISGHNYRNGTIFSNNKKLNIGDKIYITDLSKKRLSYTIYDKFEADQNYADYMVRDTVGSIEIALTTCTDDTKSRLIILAKADV